MDNTNRKYNQPEFTTFGDVGRQPVWSVTIFEYLSGHVSWKKKRRCVNVHLMF